MMIRIFSFIQTLAFNCRNYKLKLLNDSLDLDQDSDKYDEEQKQHNKKEIIDKVDALH